MNILERFSRLGLNDRPNLLSYATFLCWDLSLFAASAFAFSMMSWTKLWAANTSFGSGPVGSLRWFQSWGSFLDQQESSLGRLLGRMRGSVSWGSDLSDCLPECESVMAKCLPPTEMRDCQWVVAIVVARWALCHRTASHTISGPPSSDDVGQNHFISKIIRIVICVSTHSILMTSSIIIANVPVLTLTVNPTFH